MGASPVTPKVLDALRQYKGTEVSLADLISETELKGSQIRPVMAKLANAGMVTVIIQGQVWRHTPGGTVTGRAASRPAVVAVNPAPASSARPTGKRMFEEVGEAKNGMLIVRDEDGRLYKLTEF